jgi:hypothetical protein
VEALHHLRDVTLREEASKIRTGNAPWVMASLRNTSLRSPSSPAGAISPPPSITIGHTPTTHST